MHNRPIPVWIRVLSLVVLVLAAFLPAVVAEELRLGRELVPRWEAIKLVVDASKPDYTGSVRIELEVRKQANAFRLHAENLKLTKLVLHGLGRVIGTSHQVGERGLVTVTTETSLVPGLYTLEIEFAGQLESRPVAFFRVETGGHAYTFTHFEPDDARKAFPCWDEPPFKIPFEVTLVVPKDHLAVSNTPVVKETVEDGWKTVVFQRSKSMPSYLVAFATGPLESVPITALSVSGRIVTVKGQSHLAAEAAQVTPPILAALEKYFGSPYPYEKLDLIAIPGIGGAMENAGAVTFDDALLLLDPRTASVAQRRSLVGLIAHELAHMGFGDLVTMAWWDDLWLNESFAPWMANKIADQLYPAYQKRVREVQGAEFAMLTDARLATRAIRQPVRASDNLTLSFDELAYQKSARVLLMFEQWMGPEKFREGVRNYLHAHEWSSAVAADLFRALSGVFGRDVGAAMSTFLDQPGVPLVSAQILSDDRVRLSQQRFLNYGTKAPAALWQIPVRLKYSDGKTTRTDNLFLTKATESFALRGGGRPVWIHPNAGESSYYRWKVARETLTTLAERSREILDPRERVGLISNLSALLEAGELRGDDYLRLLAQFGEDPHPAVVSGQLGALGKIRFAFITAEFEEPFAAYVRKTLGPALARFGLTKAAGEDEAVSLLRPGLIRWLAAEGRDTKVLEFAESLARAYLKNPASVDPALAGVALQLSGIHGNEALFETYRKRFETAQVPGERDLFLSTLGSFRDPKLVEKALKYALEGPLRPRETLAIPFSLWRPQFEERAFDWMRENYATISARIPQAYFLPLFLPLFARGCSASLLERARTFFAQPAHSPPGTDKQLAKVAEAVTDCARLREREGRVVAEFLRQGR